MCIANLISGSIIIYIVCIWSYVMGSKGFSLIELIVVIAIVAILAAAAVPAYKNYVIRSKMINSLNIISAVLDAQMLTHQVDGVLPTSIDINNVNVGVGAWETVNFEDIHQIVNFQHADGRASGFVISLYGLDGIPGYSDPPTGNARNQFAIAARELDDGTIQIACGPWNMTSFGPYYVPIEYLPAECNCNHVVNFYNNSGTCDG